MCHSSWCISTLIPRQNECNYNYRYHRRGERRGGGYWCNANYVLFGQNVDTLPDFNPFPAKQFVHCHDPSIELSQKRCTIGRDPSCRDLTQKGVSRARRFINFRVACSAWKSTTTTKKSRFKQDVVWRQYGNWKHFLGRHNDAPRAGKGLMPIFTESDCQCYLRIYGVDIV